MDQVTIQGIKANDHRILSRVITRIENDDYVHDQGFIELYDQAQKAIRLGITGPPGAGKSTITNELIKRFLEKNQTIGVIAIDPSSPFIDGALLGDRVRMNHYTNDKSVFIRSMSTHGNLGGLARKYQEAGDVLAASGKDIIIFESTVYPGCTEEDCLPIIEKYSGLTAEVNFKYGYSPERINPGDKKRPLVKIRKITSGSTPSIANKVDQIYIKNHEDGIKYDDPSINIKWELNRDQIILSAKDNNL